MLALLHAESPVLLYCRITELNEALAGAVTFAVTLITVPELMSVVEFGEYVTLLKSGERAYFIMRKSQELVELNAR